ncbi:MAG TPA: cupin domain-containing protein [Steroidobacteraceae bacterium]|nr:cupin domain-containing protein [Steroidobacteraceae bacterium]
MPKANYLSSLADAVAALDASRNFFYPLRHGSMRVGVYAPSGFDDQTPHEQDELYIVRRGSADFIKNGERSAVRPDDLIFVEAGAVHRFAEISEDFLTWVVFWGPHGGESAAGPG